MEHFSSTSQRKGGLFLKLCIIYVSMYNSILVFVLLSLQGAIFLYFTRPQKNVAVDLMVQLLQ